jgi:hypothetical protein
MLKKVFRAVERAATLVSTTAPRELPLQAPPLNSKHLEKGQAKRHQHEQIEKK